MFKHILVPTDGSALSTDTVKKAVDFAREIGAKVTFFYAKPDYPVAFYGEGALIDPTTPEKFAEMADKQAGEILDAAAASGCDLIFMASHGRRGLSGLLLGSETQKVLTHSKVPVLVYR